MSFNIEEIKNDFKNVIEYSQDIPNPKLNKLFDMWFENKKRFIEGFGNKLIVELNSVTVQLSQSRKNDIFYAYLNQVDNLFYSTYPAYKNLRLDFRNFLLAGML